MTLAILIWSCEIAGVAGILSSLFPAVQASNNLRFGTVWAGESCGSLVISHVLLA